LTQHAARIRALLFDKDGTLLDFRVTWLPAYDKIVREVAGGDAALALRLLLAGGYDPGAGTIDPRSVLAAGTNDEIAALWAGMAGIPDVAALAARIDAEFQAQTETALVPVTDLAPLFGRLRRRGLRLGVATNDSEAALRAQLSRLGLSELVDFAAGFDSGHGAKPGPGMAQAFCARLRLAPAEMGVVGDSRHDLEMGRAAGAGLLVGVLTGASGYEDLRPHAHRVIASIAEIESVLS